MRADSAAYGFGRTDSEKTAGREPFLRRITLNPVDFI